MDILFNNAGIYFAENTVECSEEHWDLTIDISLKGTFLMSKFALPSMIEQGSGVIINVSSGWGVQGGEKAVSYCAAKGGIVVMTKAMAIDHAAQGIRVNCLSPGDVKTPMLDEDARAQGLTWDEYYAQAAGQRPMGRIGTPEEIAKAALFLASDDSTYMTGANLVVDGGGQASQGGLGRRFKGSVDLGPGSQAPPRFLALGWPGARSPDGKPGRRQASREVRCRPQGDPRAGD